jgi:hypothetical protein
MDGYAVFHLNQRTFSSALNLNRSVNVCLLTMPMSWASKRIHIPQPTSSLSCASVVLCFVLCLWDSARVFDAKFKSIFGGKWSICNRS